MWVLTQPPPSMEEVPEGRKGAPAGVAAHMPGHKSLIHAFTDSASARQIHPAALPRPFFKGLHDWG
jgi:hypothetical protein